MPRLVDPAASARVDRRRRRKGRVLAFLARVLAWPLSFALLLLGLVLRLGGLAGRFLFSLGLRFSAGAYEEHVESVRLARELKVSRLKANVGLSVYPGTPLYESAKEAGILPPDYSYARGWEDTELRYGNGETPRWYTPHVSRERLLQLRKETEVNILFTRLTPRTLVHRARKFARRFRRHPGETARHVAQFAGSLVSNSGLLGRRPAVPDPVAVDDRPRVGA